uniref:GATOR2 complex protein WDR24 n=1 Tax=Phallusia mammillata TaxID=59560 RepID=A0A6F9DX26_9ASCI|nr:WD repeat-containing protein 24-like [Phallusia mammillata]
MMRGNKPVMINVGSSVNALSLSKDNSKVVIAGRALLKIYNVDETNGFTEHLNLHVGRKQGLNMSCSDVAWSSVDETLVATAATNGAVVAWDLSAPGREKKLAILAEHRRTVTKVSFHNFEANLLISGSQDGTMKLFDLRKRESTSTFQSKADGVRSVQFNPHEYFLFAASFDNGYVQIWDYRRPTGCVNQFIAHKGSVYTLDWHPDADRKMTLATGGRDNMVKVWSFENNKEKEINNVPTMSSVSSVKWRPHHPEQIATVSMMLDFSVNVWHLGRKYVPFAHFEVHKDSPSGIAWKQTDSNYIFSCSKDGNLMMHAMRDASCPADQSVSSGLAFSSCGFIAHSSQTSNTMVRAQSPLGSSSKLPAIFGWKAGMKDMVEIENLPDSPLATAPRTSHFLNAKSKFRIFTSVHYETKPCVDFDDYPDSTSHIFEHMTMKNFIFAARKYILDGASANLTFSELCHYNSEVALDAGLCNVARTWKLLGVFFHKDILLNKSSTKVESGEKLKKLESENKRHSLTVKKDEIHGSQIISNTMNDIDSEHHSDDGRLQIEDYLTDIARGRQSEPDLYMTDDDPGFGYGGITSEAEFLSEHEYSYVPSEAFQQREDIELDAIAKFGHIEPPSGINVDTESEKRILTAHGGRWHEKVVPKTMELSSSPSPPANEDDNISEGVINVRPTLWPAPLDEIKEDIACQQLEYFAEMNDIQTPVVMLLAMSSYPTPVILPIKSETVEHWQSSYLDLLAKNQLWVEHAKVVKLSRVPAVQALSSSSTFTLGCQVCQRRLPSSNPWSCDRRMDGEHQNKAVSCFYCQLPVRGRYTYCQGCSFGGHSSCMAAWIKLCQANRTPIVCKYHCV